ncbi:MAG: SAF domain-containing protein [Pseudonocardiaceae bacterium]
MAPLLRERWNALRQGAGFSRTLVLRRATAAALVALAAVLALVPAPWTATTDLVVVAARDLTPGTVLAASDLTLHELPEQGVPDGATRDAGAVLSRTVAAPVRRGEPLTDVRLAGPELARAISMDPGTVSVPLRLADSGVAALLHPGATVDVVTTGERQDETVVLARGARVLAVLDADARATERGGSLVLAALDPVAATRVAAASISQTLAVTVH